eukprot:TRINITY_DN11727_c0_g1_i1.p1 TRINITY_DN11727_c0_g1~~TRINITY_DN11727_c0_g1_i1.p1  ORF type:complete len:228 (-),score=45.93 TRINITY_DN11727_c0_g1_i1:133-816(-)
MSARYGRKADSWSCGVIMFEMLLGQEKLGDDLPQVFQPKESLDDPNEELDLIFNILPHTLEDIQHFGLNPNRYKDICFEDLFPRSNEQELEMLRGLLSIDPSKRFSALDALKSPYVAENVKYFDPAVFDKSEIPEINQRIENIIKTEDYVRELKASQFRILESFIDSPKGSKGVRRKDADLSKIELEMVQHLKECLNEVLEKWDHSVDRVVVYKMVVVESEEKHARE